MTARARFVDSISDQATVRLDLLASPWQLTGESRFDPPKAKRATASTLLMDGSIYPAAAYEDRVLELHLLMEEASTDAAAAAVQKLARELDRPRNFFELRLEGQSESVFFRTIRIAMESVDIFNKGRDQLIVAPVIAEPFGYGLLETPVSAATVSANPAAMSNACFVDVTGVKGDVETPAIIDWPDSAVALGQETLFAVRRRGTPANTPFVFQAEAMTQGTDTTQQANDSDFSGSGSNYSRCTFGTNASLTPRLSLDDLGTASPDLRGTYRVFLRYRKNTGSNAISLQLQWGDVGLLDPIDNDPVATPNTTDICLADLGLIRIPHGIDPVEDLRSGTDLVVADDFALAVLAERTSGSGSIDFDCLMLVPADDRSAIVKWPLYSGASTRHVLDAFDNSVHHRNGSDQIVAEKAPALVGGLPMLTPGQTNRIYMLYEVGAGNEHDISTDVAVSVSYYPLYLSVRPVST